MPPPETPSTRSTSSPAVHSNPAYDPSSLYSTSPSHNSLSLSSRRSTHSLRSLPDPMDDPAGATATGGSSAHPSRAHTPRPADKRAYPAVEAGEEDAVPLASHTLVAMAVSPDGPMPPSSASPPSSLHGRPAVEEEDDPLAEPELDSGTLAMLRRWRNKEATRNLFIAAVKMAVLFLVCTAVLVGTIYGLMPQVTPEDRPYIKVPKSFDDLKALNKVLQHYKDAHFWRVMVCWFVVYMFLQAFSLPGSMYLSILGGAMWGVPIALPLACFSVATGALICYLISAALGTALLALPKWKERVDLWSRKVDQHRENLISYLIVLRIAPFPPHWVINVCCPHLGVGIPVFWVSTFLGIFGVSVIHTTIGAQLDQMTSSADFHLISWRNFFGLAGIVVAALIPIGIRTVFRKEAEDVSETAAVAEAAEQTAVDDVDAHERQTSALAYEDEEDEEEDELERAEEEDLLPSDRAALAAARNSGKARAIDQAQAQPPRLVLLPPSSSDEDDDEDNDDGDGDGDGVAADEPLLRGPAPAQEKSGSAWRRLGRAWSGSTERSARG